MSMHNYLHTDCILDLMDSVVHILLLQVSNQQKLPFQHKDLHNLQWLDRCNPWQKFHRNTCQTSSLGRLLLLQLLSGTVWINNSSIQHIFPQLLFCNCYWYHKDGLNVQLHLDRRILFSNWIYYIFRSRLLWVWAYWFANSVGSFSISPSGVEKSSYMFPVNVPQRPWTFPWKLPGTSA